MIHMILEEVSKTPIIPNNKNLKKCSAINCRPLLLRSRNFRSPFPSPKQHSALMRSRSHLHSPFSRSSWLHFTLPRPRASTRQCSSTNPNSHLTDTTVVDDAVAAERVPSPGVHRTTSSTPPLKPRDSPPKAAPGVPFAMSAGERRPGMELRVRRRTKDTERGSPDSDPPDRQPIPRPLRHAAVGHPDEVPDGPRATVREGFRVYAPPRRARNFFHASRRRWVPRRCGNRSIVAAP
mmetsp:Transcript_37157/g.72977  ORF Transcript_37157/g.72977 Transcript_37157/m.72977 type:complete len:236 (-) Transcript_37157:136-843(-)